MHYYILWDGQTTQGFAESGGLMGQRGMHGMHGQRIYFAESMENDRELVPAACFTQAGHTNRKQ